MWLILFRGLLVGLLGGILAGLVEAVSIVVTAPVMRAALLEAGLYALVVDGLTGAGICGLASLVFFLALKVTRRTLAPTQVAAIQVSGCIALVLLLAGLLWTFREQGSDLVVGIPTHLLFAVVFVAVAMGAFAHPLAAAVGASALSSVRRVGAAALSGTLALALVFPVQIGLETVQQLRPATTSTTGLQSIDPVILAADLRPDLEQSLEEAFGRGRSDTTRPNVLLLTVDALRADHLGACGNGWIKTPSLDLLAQYSAVSCSMYTQQPQTNPALASVFTSTYPSTHGVRKHMVDRLADSFDTLAEIMQRSGYNTSAVIPWTSLEPAFSGFHQGFQTYEAFVLNEPKVLKNPATAALAGIYRRVTDQVALGGAVEAVLGMREGTEAEIDGRADLTTGAAANWIAVNKDNPFFLWVHYFDPHYPWTPPEPWDQLYDQGYEGPYDGGMGFIYEMREGIFKPSPRDVDYLRALYASEVSYADYYIGQLLGYMAQTGLLKNTIVVLTADHGESLGERGVAWPSGDYWLHGDDVYVTGIQVPFIVYDPRAQRGRQDITLPLQHIDIMPTILDLVGLPVPRQAQGRSIVPLLLGTENGLDRIAVTSLGDDSVTGLTTADGWKLIVDRRAGNRELYFLPTDKDERVNLARQFPDRVASLSRRLEEWAQNSQAGLVGAGDRPGQGG